MELGGFKGRSDYHALRGQEKGILHLHYPEKWQG